jgi:hypothetical protein
MTEIRNLAEIVAIDVVGYPCLERASPARRMQFGNTAKPAVHSWRVEPVHAVIE